MLTVAIAGLGNIGSGVVRLLQENAELIAARAGMPIVVKAVCARKKTKKRNCDLSDIAWIENPGKLAQSGAKAVVELIGGTDGVALTVAESALNAGKHFVTANKAMIAVQGTKLARLAEQHKVQLKFEAAVAGGVPVIKTLRESLAADKVATVYGILNGTSNFILTRMRETGLSFGAALAEAQEKGFAEADPAADIDGHDSANKLSILAALAFGIEPDLSAVQTDGIRHIMPIDLQFAEDLDCRIKLLGVARMTDAGLEQHVGPILLPLSSPLARIDGSLNAVLMRGSHAGDITLEGQGAGAGPTADAVVADLIDIARGYASPAFGIPALQLKKAWPAAAARIARYYMRIQVIDKPGVVADISAVLRDEAISIESLLQRGKSATESVPVVITTHATKNSAIRRAVDKIAQLPTVVEKPCLMQIED